MLMPLFDRRALGRIACAVLIGLVACAEQSPINVVPALPGAPVIPPAFRASAFVLDVSTLRRTVKISAPTSGVASRASAFGMESRSNGVTRSLLGADVIDLTVSNFVAGALGAVQPGKVLISFDLILTNKLPRVALVTPTFPTPAAGVSGVQAFPFEITVLPISGGVSSADNEVLVTSPRYGAVFASDDWDGTPHNFFNDAGCQASSNDCFRYETFPSIGPLSSSVSRRVGFLIDPTVGDFRVKLIIAADLAPAQIQLGTLRGTVTSRQFGPVPNAIVSVAGGGSAITDSTGAYGIADVGEGIQNIAVANVPSGCTSPVGQTVTITENVTARANVTIDCSAAIGRIFVRVRTVLGGVLEGVLVVATPEGGAPTLPLTTDDAGDVAFPSAPVLAGAGALSVSNLPPACANPGPVPFSFVSRTGLPRTLELDLMVTCTENISYPLTATWGPITATGPTGRQVTMDLAMDMGSAPGRIDINGPRADPLEWIQFHLDYRSVLSFRQGITPNPAQIAFIGRQPVGGGTLFALVANIDSPRTGAFQVVRLVFDIAPGAGGSVSAVLSVGETVST